MTGASTTFWGRSSFACIEAPPRVEITKIGGKNSIPSFQSTLFQIFIFCPKIQLCFSEKIVDFFGVKNSWKCCGFGLPSCWQLWFHEKNCQKNLGEKLVKMLGFCQNWIFRQKSDFSNSVIWYRFSKERSLSILCSVLGAPHLSFVKKPLWRLSSYKDGWKARNCW